MYMRRGIAGFQPGPDTSDSCGGATPCSFGDWFSMSPECAQFMVCADPSFVKTVSTLASNPAAVQPLIVAGVATAPYAGEAAGQIANAVIPSAGDAAKGFLDSANPSTLIWAGAALLAAVFILPKVIR